MLCHFIAIFKDTLIRLEKVDLGGNDSSFQQFLLYQGKFESHRSRSAARSCQLVCSCREGCELLSSLAHFSFNTRFARTYLYCFNYSLKCHLAVIVCITREINVSFIDNAPACLASTASNFASVFAPVPFIEGLYPDTIDLRLKHDRTLRH